MSDNFEKYDGLDAKKAHAFLEDLGDKPDVLRAYVLHERGDKDRSSVLTEDILEAALQPSTGSDEDVPLDVPAGVEPGVTPGWPVDDDGTPLALPDSVRDLLARQAEEIEQLSEEKGDSDVSDDADDLTREAITALLEEKRTYEQRGEADKAKAVDAELKAVKARGKKPADRATQR